MSCNLETNTVSQIASTDHQVTSLFAAHTSLLVLEEGFEPNEARKQQQTNKQTNKRHPWIASVRNPNFLAADKAREAVLCLTHSRLEREHFEWSEFSLFPGD